MKPRIVLINPKIKKASQNKAINAIVNISFPTSLGILYAHLNSFDINDIRIIDEQITPLKDNEWIEILSSMQEPKVIGISVLTLNASRAYEIVRHIKTIDPRALVVLGGIHPTVVPDESLQIEGVDVVVRGEGEETFKELLDLVFAGQNYTHIAGISYKRGKDIIHNSNRPFIKNLDDIPPFPYHLFEKHIQRYPNFSSVFSSRGCPYNCIFCSTRSMTGRSYRVNSIGRIVEDCKKLVNTYHQQSVLFLDDNIAVDKKHFMELCDALIKEGLHKKAFFHASMRGDNATDEIIEKALEANFKIVYFGLETCNERLMKIINKGETLAEIVEAIERSTRKGLTVGATVILGLPTETRQERKEIIQFAQQLPVSSLRFNTLTPYPGTPVFVEEFPKGNIFIKGQWENFGVQYMWESDDIPYVPEGNDRLELIFDTMWANLSYYLSVNGIKRLFTQNVAAGNVIKLKKSWYLSMNELIKMGRAFFYLFRRFMNVAIRMLWEKMTPSSEVKH